MKKIFTFLALVTLACSANAATSSYSGGTEIQQVSAQSVALGSGDVTLDAGVGFDETGGTLTAGWSDRTELQGIISGVGALTINKAGCGSVILTGNNFCYDPVSIQEGAILGDTGAIAGDLTIDAGGKLVFSTTDTLTVGGTVTLESSFGIDDLVGLSSSTADGTYILIDETASTFSHMENFGIGNVFDLGDGKSAYFENGGLQLTVIPEPATLGLVVVFGVGLLFGRRRSGIKQTIKIVLKRWM